MRHPHGPQCSSPASTTLTRQIASLLLTLTMALLTGCALTPPGTTEERVKMTAAGVPYTQPFEKRQNPDLPTDPSWRDVLRRAFYANGELEAAYHEWAAAVQRIDVESAYPNTNLQVGFDYMFSKEKMKSWNRTTISAGFDPSMMLQWPEKVKRAGEIAYQEARARGHRFASVKFSLQQKVLTAWADYALTAEKVRIQEKSVALVKMLMDTAAQRVGAGAPQQDLLKAQTEYEMAGNELAGMRAELRSMAAMLNGMMARPAEAALRPPTTLPAPRPLVVDEARLIAVAVDANPELAALAREVAGRKDALELARMAYIPDIAPQLSMTGSISQAVGAMVTLPTNLVKIRASIREAESMLRASEAMARQTRSERAAVFVAALVALRDHERQAALFKDVILPKAQQVLAASTQAYATGAIGFGEMIDSQRTLLDVSRLVAEARTAREKRLAELETLAGVDIEALGYPTTQPTASPNSAPSTAGRTLAAAPEAYDSLPGHTTRTRPQRGGSAK